MIYSNTAISKSLAYPTSKDSRPALCLSRSPRTKNYDSRFVLTLTTIFLTLLALSSLAIGFTSFLFGRENASDLSTQIIEQTSNRIDLRIRALLDVALSQSQDQ